MLDDRIILQDRGYDAGLAALIQNGNKGISDPYALMAMMNNGGFGGNGGWLWIILLWALWGNNGMNGRNGAFGCVDNQLQTIQETIADNQNSSLLMDAIKGNNVAIGQLATTLNCDFNTLNSAICAVQGAIDKVSGQVGFSAERVINAVNQGDCGIITAIKDCCCNTQQSILKMGYENQLANCNQTNTLISAINTVNNGMERGFSSVAYETQKQTCDLKEIIKDSTAQILAGQRAAEMREMQNKIDALRDERAAYQLSALSQTQTENIVSKIRPCPIPAYLTCNPYDSNVYGYNGYVNGGCCA